MAQGDEPPLPRLHTATVQADRTILIALPVSMLASRAPLRRSLEQLHTRERAELCVIRQALAAAPIFSALSHARLVGLAKHFEVRTLAAGDRVVEEGKRVDAFYILLHGRVVASQRTGWARMRKRLSSGTLGIGGGNANAPERVLHAITRDAHIPFFGEKALNEKRPFARGQVDDPSPTSIRATERSCVLALKRDSLTAFLAAFPTFRDLLIQRQHLAIKTTMHEIAVQQAIEKHQDDRAHPSRELQEALSLARTPNLHYINKRYRAPPEPAPHPHAPSRPQRRRATDQAMAAMVAGIEAVSVATKMGICPRPGPDAAHRAGESPPQDARGAPTPMMGRSASSGALARAPSMADPWSTVTRRPSMAERASGLVPTAGRDTAGTRFLDALWELQAAKKVLESQ